MRLTVAIIMVAATTAACGRPPLARPAATTAAIDLHHTCGRPQGAAVGVRAYVVELVTSADSEIVASRRKLQLPALLDSSQVAFETDPAICAIAVKALAAAQRDTTGSATAAYVLRLDGAGYVVWNNEQVGEFFSYYVFDRDMTLLTAFMS